MKILAAILVLTLSATTWCAPLTEVHNHTEFHNHTAEPLRDGKNFHNNKFDVGNIDVSGNVTGDTVSIGHSVKISINATRAKDYLYEHGESQTAESNKWSYRGATGPRHWPTLFPMCNGTQESPIDIKKDSAISEDLPPIKLDNYDSITAKNTQVVNNGHSVELEAVGENKAKLSGGLYLLDYEFLQLHFHWGSEHTLEGHQFPLELHMVHKWSRLELLGMGPKDLHLGLGVVGFFFEVSDEDNEDSAPFIEAIERIPESGSTTKLERDLSIPSLISPVVDTSGVFTYSGGLTTPTCDQVVLWSVFEEPLKISQAQLDAFKTLKDSHGEPMKDNFRHPQPMHDRKLAYFKNSGY